MRHDDFGQGQRVIISRKIPHCQNTIVIHKVQIWRGAWFIFMQKRHGWFSRDDLEDGGAEHYAQTVQAIKPYHKFKFLKQTRNK